MPMPQTDTSDAKAVEAPNYSDEEKKQRSMLVDRFSRARDLREQQWEEFDDYTYYHSYVTNRRNRNGYINPKKNDQEVRVSTATTREKCNSILSSLLNFNFAADIQTFDVTGKEVAFDGTNIGLYLSDLDRKQKEMEDYETLGVMIYDEYVTQGTVFVEKSYVEREIITKAVTKSTGPLDKYDWSESKETHGEIKTTLLCGLNVFLGDIRQPNIKLQPYVFTREEIPYSDAKSIYGDLARFENVPEDLANFDSSDDYNPWTLYPVQKDRVEVLKYQDVYTNEYQIVINGVLMLGVGFPLSELSGQIGYTISQANNEAIPGFAYGRGISFKTKFDQAMVDEMFRAIIVKTRQSYNPAWANNTGKKLTSAIFEPGTMVSNVNPEKIKPLMESRGVTQSEFNAFEFVKQIVDEKTVSGTFEGQVSDATARAVVEAQKQAMIKIGLTIMGILNLEKQLAWLNINFILKYWTKGEQDDINEKKALIKTHEVDVDFEDAQGIRIIEFADQVPQPEQLSAESNIISKLRDKKVEKVVLNRKDLRQMKYDYHIVVTPTEKETSEVKKAVFLEFITTMFQLFGPQAFNQSSLARRLVFQQGENPDQLLNDQQNIDAAQALAQQGGQPGQPGPPGQTANAQLIPQQTNRPTVNTLA